LQIFERRNINSLSKNNRFNKISTTRIFFTIFIETTQSTYCLEFSYNSVNNIKKICAININRNMLLIVYTNSIVIISNIFNNLTLINFIIVKLLIKRSSKYLIIKFSLRL